MSTERMKLDLTNETIRPLVIEDAETGLKMRYTFTKILNRQQRAMMTRKVGKGNQAKEVPDLDRLFKTCIATMGPVDITGLPEGAIEADGIIRKPDIIAQVLVIPENRGGLPEEHVEKLVRYLMGENVLGEDRGND